MIWNLIPVNKQINSKKNDRLPKFEKYFKPFSELQYNAFNTAMGINISYKLLEDYLTLPKIILTKNFPKKRFILSLKETIQPLYQVAVNQGFEIWEI